MIQTLSRRNFIKLGLKATALVSIGSQIGGCGAVIFENREEINAQLESHPAVPTPANGCYLGKFSPVVQHSLGPYRERILGNLSKKTMESEIDSYEGRFGHRPALYCPIDTHVGYEDFFPLKFCEVMASKGIIPLLRYYITFGFRDTANGKHDDIIKKFGDNRCKFPYPIVLVPYPEISIKKKSSGHPWRGKSGEWFAEAYVHIREVLDAIGASQNTVYGFHVMGGVSAQNLNQFALPPEAFDWFGYSIYNSTKCAGGDISFWQLVEGQNPYIWGARKYPTKPQALFEFGTSSLSGVAGSWIRDAFATIKRYPRIKMAMYWETPLGNRECSEDTYLFLNPKAEQAYREATSDSYYLKAKTFKKIR